MTRPAFTFTPGRHPAEYCAFGVGALGGPLGLLVPDARSAAVTAQFPPWVVVGWYLGLSLWGWFGVGALALVRDQADRQRLEEIACYGYGYIGLFYVGAAIYAQGGRGVTAALGYGWLTAFATWRIVQIRFEARRWRRVQALDVPADPAPLGVPDERPDPR